jgi:hypothetical protein
MEATSSQIPDAAVVAVQSPKRFARKPLFALAKLIAGNDLTKVTPATRAILMNPEVIAVDQDRSSVQGHMIRRLGPLEVWM